VKAYTDAVKRKFKKLKVLRKVFHLLCQLWHYAKLLLYEALKIRFDKLPLEANKFRLWRPIYGAYNWRL